MNYGCEEPKDLIESNQPIQALFNIKKLDNYNFKIIILEYW